MTHAFSFLHISSIICMDLKTNNCEYLTNNKNVDLNDKSYFKIFEKIINLSRSKPSLLSISLFLSFIDEISYLKQISTLNIFIAS